MGKKVLLVRPAPYDFDPAAYNAQPTGMGKAFCRLGYDFDVVAFNKSNPGESVFYEYQGNRAKYILLNRFRLIRMGINKSVYNPKFLEQYDIIICMEYYQILTYLVAKNAKNVFLYSGPYYNLFLFKFISPLYDLLFTKKLNNLIKVKFVKSELAAAYLRNKGYSNISVVGVGLDTSRFNGDIHVENETAKIVNFMQNNECILYVGALSERKNFPFLLDVYQALLRKRSDLKFVIVGRSVVGPFSKLCGKKASSYANGVLKNYPDSVKNGLYHINRLDNPQLKYIYPLAKAFLLPSKKEIFGMVLLEAMYLGAPIVTSYNGGSDTLIKDGRTGQIINDFDVNKWADAVNRYFDDITFTKEIVSRARRKIENEFTWDSVVKKMLEQIEG